MAYRCKALPALTDPKDVTDKLNRAEGNGWELVAMTHIPGPTSEGQILYAFRLRSRIGGDMEIEEGLTHF